MDSAKNAVQEFLKDNNKHTVDIHQKHEPAVVHERLQRAEHENITTALERERHQDHHQLHVQPLHDKVVDPEQHTHRVIATEHREQRHGKDAEVTRALEGQRSQFKDEQEILPTERSQSNTTLVGERVHHHIYDTIQPVVEREHLQQHVIHTTVPVHETIHEAPVIHSGNVLPSKSLAEWQAEGGNSSHKLTGKTETHEHIDYEGDPLNIKDNSSVGFSHASRHEGLGTHGRPGELGTATGVPGAAGIVGAGHHHSAGAGPHSSSVANKLDPRVDSDGSKGLGAGYTTGSGTTGTGMTGTTVGGSGPHASASANKLDPRVDSDGSKGMGAGYTTGSGTTGSGLTGTHTGSGLTGTHTGSGLTGTHTGSGLTGTKTDSMLTGSQHSSSVLGGTASRGTTGDYSNTAGSGLASSTTNTNTPGTADLSSTDKPSTTEKLLAKVGLGSK